MSARWSNNDINFLIENSNKMTLLEISKHLNRTTGSVYKKSLKLGLNYKWHCVKSIETDWTMEQVAFLEKHYETLTNSFLIKRLDKSLNQIISKMEELNLNKTRYNKDHLYFDENEINFIKCNWNKMSDEELARNINESLNPCRVRTGKTIGNYRKNILKINRPINGEFTKVGNFTWTKEDETFLIDNFYSLSLSELSNCLNKTESSILNKSKRIGLRLLNSKGINWTSENIDFLKSNFNILPINAIAQELQIPVEKILCKAIELNIVYQVKQLTNPEIFVKNQLEKLNINFEYQKNIHYNRQNKYIVDYISNNIIIEVQGDYYHCNPEIYKNGPIDSIQANNIEKDRVKRDNLFNMGYIVYYIWENDINTNPKEVINFIAALFSNK